MGGFLGFWYRFVFSNMFLLFHKRAGFCGFFSFSKMVSFLVFIGVKLIQIEWFHKMNGFFRFCFLLAFSKRVGFCWCLAFFKVGFWVLAGFSFFKKGDFLLGFCYIYPFLVFNFEFFTMDFDIIHAEYKYIIGSTYNAILRIYMF